MKRLFGYYRQFDELSPEEISAELRSQRDRAPAVVERDLDLSGSAWPGPVHPEIVNAATFALRRAMNTYPDESTLRSALARLHDVGPDRISIGHGAGELLRAALRAVARREVVVAWPGWGHLPALVREAGARPIPAGLDELFAHRHPPVTTVITRPGDPTGAVVGLSELAEFASSLAPDAWLILDEALAGFLPDGEDGLIDHPRVIHVRSFSKDNAMAGFRIGYAITPSGLDLSPVLGVAAPSLAGALWATENGAESVRRRRAQAAAERARLAEFSPSPGHGPYVWLPGPPDLSAALASRGVFVAPGSAWGDDSHVRVTLRDGAATGRLVAALREVLR